MAVQVQPRHQKSRQGTSWSSSKTMSAGTNLPCIYMTNEETNLQPLQPRAPSSHDQAVRKLSSAAMSEFFGIHRKVYCLHLPKGPSSKLSGCIPCAERPGTRCITLLEKSSCAACLSDDAVCHWPRSPEVAPPTLATNSQDCTDTSKSSLQQDATTKYTHFGRLFGMSTTH